MDKYQITFRSWDKVAPLYEETYMYVDLYNESYDAFCAQVTQQHPDILEIGCGPGNITKYLLAQRPDFIIKGIDISPNMVSLARHNNPTANFQLMDARELDKISGRFDAIMCGFCLPYLSFEDVAGMIKNAAQILRPAGTIYLSTIEDAPEKSGFEVASSGDQMYVHYHKGDQLEAILEKNGFSINYLIRKNYVREDGTEQVHLILMANFSQKEG